MEDPRDIPARLAPAIKSAADEMDQSGDIPADLLAELAGAGAFQLFTPRELGGFEASLTTALQVYEEFGRIDASVGWVVWNGNWGFIGALLEPGGRDQIWAHGNPVFCNAGQPGTAVPVEGGYQVSGDWKLVSGSHGADWMITLGMIKGEKPPAVRRAP